MSTERPPKNLLTHLLTAVGYLTDPKSKPGGLFNKGERLGTGLFDRLGRNDTYLWLAGKGLKAGFVLRRGLTDAAEAWRHSLRAPTLGDVQAMRTQIRRLGDTLEVTQNQLELALAAIQRLERELTSHPAKAS
jgi:hypothetical protein